MRCRSKFVCKLRQTPPSVRLRLKRQTFHSLVFAAVPALKYVINHLFQSLHGRDLLGLCYRYDHRSPASAPPSPCACSLCPADPHSKNTTITVTLSDPRTPDIFSTSFSAIAFGSQPSSLRSLTHSTADSSSTRSQRPSEARRRKSWVGCRETRTMVGAEETQSVCCWDAIRVERNPSERGLQASQSTNVDSAVVREVDKVGKGPN